MVNIEMQSKEAETTEGIDEGFFWNHRTTNTKRQPPASQLTHHQQPTTDTDNH